MEVSDQLHAPAILPPEKQLPISIGIIDWVGSTAGMDTVSKRKIGNPHRKSNPDHPIVKPVVSRYTDSANLGFVTVRLFLCLTKNHAMKTYWGVEV
jgi:hypothetical protein